MVGTELWYPLWSSDTIPSTSTELAKLIGDNARSHGLAGNGSTHTINSTLTNNSTVAVKSVVSAGTVVVAGGNGSTSPVPSTPTTTATTSTTTSSSANTLVTDHLSVAWAVLQDVKLITKPV